MSLTLITAPEEITLAKNVNIYKIKALNGLGYLFNAVGVRATIDMVALTARLTTGQTITLTYTEPDTTMETVVFTAVNPPAADTHLPTDNTAGYNNATYWAEIARVIESHPRISPYFTVTVVGNTLVIEERTASSNWVIAATNTPGWTVTNTALQPDTTPSNYSAVLEVYTEAEFMGGNWSLAATLEATPDRDGLMTFDIASILAATTRDSRLEPIIPTWGNSSPVVADNCRRYYVRYREQSGAPVVYSDWAYDAVKYAIEGGVATAIWAEGNYIAALDADNALLTWMPDGRTLAPNEKQYLPWYNYTGDTKSVVLEVTTYDIATGAADTVAYVFDGATYTARKHETMLVPAWPTALGITNPDKYKYTVRIVDGSSDFDGGFPVYLSQERTYYITRDYSRTERYIQYLNGFGVPEMWRCTGEYSKNISIARATAQRALVAGYSPYATDTMQYLTDYTPSLTYRTGHITRAEAEVLQELYLCTGLYDVSEAGYIPLRITDNAADITSSTRDLHSYQFVAQPRLAMSIFSKRAATAAPNAWQETDLSFWLDAIIQPWEL